MLLTSEIIAQPHDSEMANCMDEMLLFPALITKFIAGYISSKL